MKPEDCMRLMLRSRWISDRGGDLDIDYTIRARLPGSDETVGYHEAAAYEAWLAEQERIRASLDATPAADGDGRYGVPEPYSEDD